MSDDDTFVEEELIILANDPRFKAVRTYDTYKKFISYSYAFEHGTTYVVCLTFVYMVLFIITVIIIYTAFAASSEIRIKLVILLLSLALLAVSIYYKNIIL